jgi:hypothetical protein
MVRALLAAAILHVAISIHAGFAQLDATPTAGIRVLTVCESLADLNRYSGQTVILVGKLGSTMEGVWLSQNCEHKLVTDGYTWADTISLAYVERVEPPPNLPKGFKWNEPLLKAKLKDVQKTTELEVLKKYHYSDKWYAVFGRFETRLPLQVVRGGGGTLWGYGFGHLSAAPAQLVANPQHGYHRLESAH